MNNNNKTTHQLDIFKYKGEPIRITLGTIVMVAICTFLIIVATFTQLTIPHFLMAPESVFNIGEGLTKDNRAYLYVPQIPIILFIAALLGRMFGLVSVLVYITLGLFFYPIFALGGGLKYLLEYNFGYILAYVPAVFFVGTILKRNYTFKNIIQATIVGVLTIHIIGILYTMFVGIITTDSDYRTFGWIIIQSSWKILYDMFFSFLAIIGANITKRILWLIMC